MGYATTPTTHRARKTLKHKCWWCGEPVTAGHQYRAWCWYEDGKSLAMTVHVECAAAWDRLPPGDGDEVGFGDYARGCNCANGECQCWRNKEIP
jgi:hypothetical protein